MSDFCQILKKETPKTFEDFRAKYLRKRYEFWNKKVGDEILYFCGRDFLSQVGYFLDWLKTEHNITIEAWESETQMRKFIKDNFNKLENEFWFNKEIETKSAKKIAMHFLRYVKIDLLDKFVEEMDAAVTNGKIKTEQQAMNFAKKYLVEGYPSYAPNLSVTKFLPRTVKTVLQENEYKHPWFTGKVKKIAYIDIWGRVWSKATGKISPQTKTEKISREYSIKESGGGMWHSPDNIFFTCQYRTNESELKETGARPETFIG